MLFQKFKVISFSLCVIGSLCGCGDRDPLGRKAISGTVEVDGKPVEQGSVSFEPVQGTTSSGGPIVAGKFSIERSMGLPIGKYRVVINAPVPGTGGKVDPTALPGDPVAIPEELIPPEWNLKSDQFIEVKAEGPFEYHFDIKTKK